MSCLETCDECEETLERLTGGVCASVEVFDLGDADDGDDARSRKRRRG